MSAVGSFLGRNKRKPSPQRVADVSQAYARRSSIDGRTPTPPRSSSTTNSFFKKNKGRRASYDSNSQIQRVASSNPYQPYQPVVAPPEPAPIVVRDEPIVVADDPLDHYSYDNGDYDYRNQRHSSHHHHPSHSSHHASSSSYHPTSSSHHTTSPVYTHTPSGSHHHRPQRRHSHTSSSYVHRPSSRGGGYTSSSSSSSSSDGGYKRGRKGYHSYNHSHQPHYTSTHHPTTTSSSFVHHPSSHHNPPYRVSPTSHRRRKHKKHHRHHHPSHHHIHSTAVHPSDIVIPEGSSKSLYEVMDGDTLLRLQKRPGARGDSLMHDYEFVAAEEPAVIVSGGVYPTSSPLTTTEYIVDQPTTTVVPSYEYAAFPNVPTYMSSTSAATSVVDAGGPIYVSGRSRSPTRPAVVSSDYIVEQPRIRTRSRSPVRSEVVVSDYAY